MCSYEGSRGDGQNLSAKLIRVGTTFVVQTLITMFWSTFLSFRIVDPCCAALGKEATRCLKPFSVGLRSKHSYTCGVTTSTKGTTDPEGFRHWQSDTVQQTYTLDSQLPSLISLFIFVWSISEANPKNNWMRGEQACLIYPPLLPPIDRLCRTRSPICQVWFAGALLRKVLRGGVRKWCKKNVDHRNLIYRLVVGVVGGDFFRCKAAHPRGARKPYLLVLGTFFKFLLPSEYRVPSALPM